MSKKNTKTILVLLGVILLIILGVYALTNQNNNETNLPSENNNEEDLQNRENVAVSAQDQRAVTTYLENNISDLSPEKAVLGGTFYVTNVNFPEKNVAIVDYEDGHIALTAQANYTFNDKEVEINSFELIEDTDVNENDINDEEDFSVQDQRAVTTYLENNISALSPEDAILGGTFYVTTVNFPERNVAIVNYEDGHQTLSALANYSFNNEEVEINSFELIPDGSTVERSHTPDIDICVDMCGDGICQEIVCMGEGCPCPETVETCPADCS